MILLDVSMPGMDGFETAELIRRRPRSELTPIIFVTSMSNSEASMIQGYSLGAVDYIVTPIVPQVLRTKVAVFVELHRKTALIQQQSEELRRAEELRHKRELAEAAYRLDAETKRNRFFTLAIDLLGIADFNGFLLQINPSWEKVLGYSEAELKSKSGLDLVHPDDHESMLKQFERMKRDDTPIYVESRYRHRDGSYRWLGWTAAPFGSEQLIYIFARDITARKAAEEEIQLLNAELSRRISDLTEVNQELESFNYSISHDLRAPLRSIASFTQVILSQSDQVNPEFIDYLRRVENAAKYMDKLLLDLLDYSRLSRSDMNLTPVSLDQAVADVLLSLDQELRSRAVELDVQRPLGCAVGHAATMRQVLFNLVGNALKFVAPGGVPRIRIWTEPQGECLRICVADSGIGIAPQFQKRIFGLFQRLHSHSTYPGTGIGLAMVQKGVERMGGRIGVESEPGQGSCFWFALPVSESAPDEQIEFAASRAPVVAKMPAGAPA